MVTDHSIANGPVLVALMSRAPAVFEAQADEDSSRRQWHLGVKLAFLARIDRLRVGAALLCGQRLLVGIEHVDDDDQSVGGAAHRCF